MRAYRAGYADVSLPGTESLAERVLCLPTGTAVTATDIARICQVLRTAVKNAARVRSRLELTT
jgi:dTDP-4-amino-4,6-dideoxyglucose